MPSLPDSCGGYHVVPDSQVPQRLKKWLSGTPEKAPSGCVFYEREKPLFVVKHHSKDAYIAVCDCRYATGMESCDQDNCVEFAFLDGQTLEETSNYSEVQKKLNESLRQWIQVKRREARQ